MKWVWAANKGNKFDGKYEGEIKDNKPHGLGKFKRDGYNQTVEGEWEDGQLNGKAVYNGSEFRQEYEAKEGKINGKFTQFNNDGSHWESEYRDGKHHGRYRKYDKDGIVTQVVVFEDGNRISE